MRKTFQYRLFPTKSQRSALNKTLEYCRWVYNDTLAIRKDTYEQTGKSISLYDTNKTLTLWKAEKPVLKSVYSQVLQNVQERVDLAFQAFFRRVRNGETPGFPRFKGYGRYDSFTYKQSGFRVTGNRLFLSKIGDVKIKLHRPIEGQVKTLTIRRDRLGNWYASFSCVVEPQPLPPTDKVVGIDLGLTTFATFSDEEKIERQRWFKQDEKDLKRVQRKVSRLPKGSAARRKAVLALNHVHQRIAGRRLNFAHQQSRKLVDFYQIIVFEDLNIAQMSSAEKGKKAISKGIADVAWGRFVQNTVAKAEEAGRTVVLVNPKNTTQACSGCGSIVPKTLSMRVHDCPHCGLKIDRDLNAAKNILARGLASLRLSEPLEAHLL
jgi:putative transposase